MEHLWELIQKHWVEIGVAYLAGVKFLTAIRDAIDKTPASDDNWFERLCTILGKAGAYLFTGRRPNPPNA